MRGMTALAGRLVGSAASQSFQFVNDADRGIRVRHAAHGRLHLAQLLRALQQLAQGAQQSLAAQLLVQDQARRPGSLKRLGIAQLVLIRCRRKRHQNSGAARRLVSCAPGFFFSEAS